MNDEHDLEPEAEQEAEQEVRVRALLADLASDPEARTTPPEVVDRLEDTVARLVAERDGRDQSDQGDQDHQGPADVVPLRRRWAPRLAAAAAAVIVVGAGGVAAADLGLFGGEGSGGSSADKATAGDAGGQSESQSQSQSQDGSPEATAVPSKPGALTSGLAAQLPRVRAASFESDVARVLRRSAAQRDTTSRRNDGGA